MLISSLLAGTQGTSPGILVYNDILSSVGQFQRNRSLLKGLGSCIGGVIDDKKDEIWAKVSGGGRETDLKYDCFKQKL